MGHVLGQAGDVQVGTFDRFGARPGVRDLPERFDTISTSSDPSAHPSFAFRNKPPLFTDVDTNVHEAVRERFRRFFSSRNRSFAMFFKSHDTVSVVAKFPEAAKRFLRSKRTFPKLQCDLHSRNLYDARSCNFFQVLQEISF